jgi:hypothetical protein
MSRIDKICLSSGAAGRPRRGTSGTAPATPWVLSRGAGTGVRRSSYLAAGDRHRGVRGQVIGKDHHRHYGHVKRDEQDQSGGQVHVGHNDKR